MLNDPVRNNEQKKTLWDRIIIQKISAPVVVLFLVLASLSVSFIIAREGFVIGVIILFVIIGAPVAYATVAYPEFGIVVLIVVSFFVNYLSRLLPEDTPIG